jgi:hypothetical protein
MADARALRRLLDLEEIKQLKARYCLYLDTKEWDAWGELFTEDIVVEGTKQPDGGRDAFVNGVSESLADVQSCHQVHSPIIEFAGEGRARGVWAMFDDLRFPEGHPWSEGYRRRVGYGHYEEEYRNEDGAWKISHLRLVRLLVWRENEGPLVEGGIRSAGRQWLEQGRAATVPA